VAVPVTRPEDRDTVVVGSGFGAGPMALRLAQAGVDVCVLERGRPYPPGSFPRSPAALGRNFWDPGDGLYGMFDIWSFRALEAVISSGLGGGSLIYANVLIRKDDRWFQEADPAGWRWPITRAELDPFYDLAEPILGANPYPFDREPYGSTPKTQAMRDAHAKVSDLVPEKLEWGLPNLAVSFTPAAQGTALGVPIPEPDGPNLHDRPRYTCRLVGECDIGCNFGAKNSIDYTYLSAAKRARAEIRTLCEVGRIEPSPHGGYLVHYVRHRPDPHLPAAARRTPAAIRARRVVLAAGTLGTTYLLLRNRGGLPGLSPALGTRFSGNGDFLGFAKKCRPVTPAGRRARRLDPSRGPVITSFIRVPDAMDPDSGAPPGARGFYIEDAGWPEFANWLVQVFDTPGMVFRAAAQARAAARRWLQRDPDSNVSSELSHLLGDAELTNASLGMLGMGRDTPDGRLRLRGDDRLDVDWNEDSSRAYFARMKLMMEHVAHALGGEFLDDPLHSFFHRLVTVHPLGGSPMGRNRDEGVVDAHGRVFGHENLFIADGSVMPGPVGANPSLTIAAFSERAARRIVDEDLGGA
jgi:cholesterol oxidase